MGSVFFNTDVDKTVNIGKTVNIDVNKDVFSSVNLSGNLATAEASADAIGGGGGGGGGGGFSGRFLIDNFEDTQFVDVDSSLGEVSDSGVAPSPPGTSFPNPDGEFFNGTDIPDAALRTATVTNLPGSVAVGSQRINPSDNGRILLSTEEDTLSDTTTSYSHDANGDGDYNDPFSVIPGCTQEDLDLTDPANALVLEGAAFGGLEEGETLRVEITIADADGDEATLRAYADASFNEVPGNQQDIVIPLGLFTGDIPGAPSAGLEILGLEGFYSTALNDTDDIDFDEVTLLEFDVVGDPNPVSVPDPDFPLPTVPENPTTDAYDVSFDEFAIVYECLGDGDGNLAETETFAQVTEDGAFSFSDSLAASDFFVG